MCSYTKQCSHAWYGRMHDKMVLLNQCTPIPVLSCTGCLVLSHTGALVWCSPIPVRLDFIGTTDLLGNMLINYLSPWKNVSTILRYLFRINYSFFLLNIPFSELLLVDFR